MNGTLLKLLKFGQRNALIHALRHHDFLQRLDGARGTNANFPAMKTQFVGDRAQNFASGFLGLVKVFLCQITIGKIAFEPGDAAH
ncbi:hypothetical protein SDC9_114870 [bioreactor metagenome]|uniref:Uncharacterized protein n=1 Tax=bioreactor metagenome TaxID=1076179 RepID=A0A645BRJ3_9ZZZZ